jgi:hypothetical protein
MGIINILGASKELLLSSEPDDPEPTSILQVVDFVQKPMSLNSECNVLLRRNDG